MKSLTEEQLRSLLKEAWEEGAEAYRGYFGSYPPKDPPDWMYRPREDLFTKLIASV